MKIEITIAKGNAYCRMCHQRYGRPNWNPKTRGYDDVTKKVTLRGKKCLKLVTHDANGESRSFYCLPCAKKIRKMFDKLEI